MTTDQNAVKTAGAVKKTLSEHQIADPSERIRTPVDRSSMQQMPCRNSSSAA